jgi:ATP/maltotriose-dependent transcriptional regulator MalT
MDALDVVTSLVGKSLLQRQEAVAGEPRFTMLETLHEYAREKLEEHGELDSAADAHFDYFLQFAERAERESFGREQILWMRRLDAEQNNLRAALEWSLSRDGRVEMGLRLAGALGAYWDDRGYLSEGRQWCTQLLSKTEHARPGMERARALRTLARLVFEQGYFPDARVIFEQSLQMSRALGDDLGVAAAFNGMGTVEMWQGEYDLSQSLYEQSLAIARRLGSRHVTKTALSNVGVILMRKEEYQAAQLPLEEALAINRELGDGAGVAVTLTQQGSVAYHLGEYDKAKGLIEESLAMARELGVEYAIAFGLARLGMVALRQRDLQRAEALLLDGLTRARSSGIRRWSRWYLAGLAEIARMQGMVTRAAKLLGASEGALSAAGAHYEPATRAEIDRIIASVRAELDEETFERLRTEGRAMVLEEIIAHTGPPTKAGETIITEGQHVYPDGLTEREVEVLRLIALGRSNQEIGQDLVLSRRTVERHVSNIYQKIGAAGKVARASASAYALRNGLAT